MNILILGNAEDAHAAHIHAALLAKGVDVEYLDTQLFPSKIKLSWQPHDADGCIQLASGKEIKLQNIHSVYWRSFNGVGVPSIDDSSQQDIAYRDSMATVRSIFQACSAHWVNSWQAYQFHQKKPLQLNLAKQLGVTIPATLVSNDARQITQFAKAYNKVIFKPVYGGSHARFVTKKHLEPERLNLALKFSPVTLQEYIPGTNIRSYVVGDSVYSAEIRTDAVDLRDDYSAKIVPVNLSAEIEQQCKKIASAFSLEWTAIDWRRNSSGEYVFLEANPSPMFIYFEEQTGFSITQKLVQLLEDV